MNKLYTIFIINSFHAKFVMQSACSVFFHLLHVAHPPFSMFIAFKIKSSQSSKRA
jgi:hypothetical protein